MGGNHKHGIRPVSLLLLFQILKGGGGGLFRASGKD